MRAAPAIVLLFMITSAFNLTQAQQPAWVPKGIENLQRSASSNAGFSFDHSMLVLASKLEPGNDDLRRVIAGISGISVRNLHFQGTGEYDPAALAAVNQEYRRAGWTQLLNRQEKDQGQGVTDLWVRMENNAISNVAILLARPQQVSFVEISGSISPVDISHLAGHFGIPKIEGGMVIADRQHRP